MLRYVLAFALLIFPATAWSAPAPTVGQLEQSLRLGQLLYQYDQSAWHVTDAALPALSDQAKQVARGYVTTPIAKGLKTTFFGELNGQYVTLYSAVWTGSSIAQPQIYAPDQRMPLTPEELRLVRARQVAIESAGSLKLCNSSPPNIIVIPERNSDLVHVYALTPQTAADAYPFGGHHRIDVRDGKVVATRKFANTCIQISKSSIPKGARAQAFTITHLLDPVPTEIHVFNALSSRTMVMVGTTSNMMMYSIHPAGDRAKIKVLGPIK